MKNLNIAMRKAAEKMAAVAQKELELKQAVSEAREAYDELGTYLEEHINKPHIAIGEYEIDN